MEALKVEGNAAFSNGDYILAIKKFTEAIQLDSSNHVLYSNRSAAYCAAKDYENALEDAEKTIFLNPSWSKGYGRKGAALQGLKRFDDAKATYEEGLKYEPSSPQLKKGLEEVELASEDPKASEVPFAGNPFANFNPFNNSEAMDRIARNPSCKAFMAQPDFLIKMEQIKKNPSSLSQYMNDPRILQAAIVAMGIDVNNMEAKKNAHSGTVPKSTPVEEKESSSYSSPSTSSNPSEPNKKTEKEQTKISTPPKPDSPRALSDKEKELGNKEYSNKNFEKALEHYERALELDETNITIFLNKSAVLFEKEMYDDCIKLCNEVVEKGRDSHADYKIIAKAFGRIGTAYAKKGDHDEAIKYYNKSLTEHRTPDILNKLRDIEKERDIARKQELYNPAISETERNSGNEAFKKGDFVTALNHYNEAIKRDEKDPRNWSNRAACYTKLAAFPEAIKDCDKAIELDPTFIKAYLRKATIFASKKEHQKAMDVLHQAHDYDKDGKHRTEIESQLTKCYNDMNEETSHLSPEETMKRAMSDPELRQILTDPVMQQILQQMQGDPKAIMEHMKNPIVAGKIRKLMTAGIIRLG